MDENVVGWIIGNRAGLLDEDEMISVNRVRDEVIERQIERLYRNGDE